MAGHDGGNGLAASVSAAAKVRRLHCGMQRLARAIALFSRHSGCFARFQGSNIPRLGGLFCQLT